MRPKKHVFTTLEKECFVDILQKYAKIIESRETDGATLKLKNEAWVKVTAEFNTSPLSTSQATHKQLRRLWMNLKQRQREGLPKDNQRRLATGGGSSTSDADIDSDSVLERIVNSPEFGPEEVIIINPEPSTTPETPILPKVVPGTEYPVTLSAPLPSTASSQLVRQMQIPQSIIEKEYKERQWRADEKHILEMKILRHQLREVKAKADLAVLILKHKQNE